MEQSTWIGRSLNGRYKIDALLGQGGMSAVYKALDPNLKRVVAIKLIHPHLSTEDDFIHRFKREAAAVASLRHQNIIQVYDFNTDNDVYYMVLEFVPGETLQDRLKHLKKSNVKMPIDQAIKVILNVCDALTYAHKQGMIHRDIKPANIMLDLHGQAILMDFGIVKILDDTSHTATGAVVGTARYMSPEVIRSEVPDERSDLYSLGVTFYEMLSGDPPFNADSAMSLLMRHLNDPVPDLGSKRHDLPHELIRIVNKSLEKDRDNRYRSASDMAGDLRRLLSTLETAPIPATLSTPVPAPRTEDQTEPWEAPALVRSQEGSVFSKPTTVERPPQPVNIPRHEPPKADVKPVPSPRAASLSPLVKYGGLGGLALALAIGFFAVRGAFSPAPEPTANATPTFTQPAPAATSTVLVSTAAPAFTPSETPTPTLEPTATSTLPPLYVRINNISVNDAGYYVVEYETFGYTEVLPGQHVHFFFNTVSVEQAGMPGSGPWKLYGGPRPFDEYRVSDKPVAATQICALVANPNHSIIPESGNCFDLPQ